MNQLEPFHQRWRNAVRDDASLDETSIALYEAESGLSYFGDLPLRLQRWLSNLYELWAFVDRYGGWPIAGVRHGVESNPDGRRLANWVRYQRRHEASLCRYQRERLEDLPAFSWAPLDDQWDAMLVSWKAFANEAGKLPVLSGETPLERSLAAWAAQQRRLGRLRRLPAHRKTELEGVTGWWWTP